MIMQKAEEHRNELLIQIARKLGKAKASIKPNYVDSVKNVIPVIIEQVKELRGEISRAEVQKDMLGGLLLKKLIEKPPATESPKNRSTQQKQPESTAGGNTRREVNQALLNRGGAGGFGGSKRKELNSPLGKVTQDQGQRSPK